MRNINCIENRVEQNTELTSPIMHFPQQWFGLNSVVYIIWTNISPTVDRLHVMK